MTKFITEDDIWGIRQAVRQIFNNNFKRKVLFDSEYSQWLEVVFNAFFNQFIPETWRETESTVLRHYDEIKLLAKGHPAKGEIWIKSNGQLKCTVVNRDLIRRFEEGGIEFPTYLEIEEEKMKWQNQENYKYKERTEPIREELIQLRIVKK